MKHEEKKKIYKQSLEDFLAKGGKIERVGFKADYGVFKRHGRPYRPKIVSKNVEDKKA